MPLNLLIKSIIQTGILDVWNFSKDGHFQHVSETSVKDGPCEMVVLTSHAAPWECYIGCSSGIIISISFFIN